MTNQLYREMDDSIVENLFGIAVIEKAMQYAEHEKSRVRIIDSTRSTGKVSQREFSISELFEQGYLVYRKR